MLSKSEIKNISRLKQKKYRLSERVFVVEGVRPVKEALDSRYTVSRLLVTESQIAGFSKHEQCEQVTSAQMQQVSGMKTPPGVMALVEFPENENLLLTGGVLLAEALNDPGNLGSILRTADWFGIKTVILSEDSVDVFNPKTVQASMGSVFRVAVSYMNLQEAVQQLKAKGVEVYGAALNGKNVYKTRFTSRFALVLGSESHGLSPQITEICDEIVTIPSFGRAESLNVGVSCAVISAEIKRSLTFEVK